MRHSDAPSIRAASPSSIGTVRKNCRYRKQPREDARFGTSRPGQVLTQCASASSWTTGTSTTVNGIISPLSTT